MTSIQRQTSPADSDAKYTVTAIALDALPQLTADDCPNDFNRMLFAGNVAVQTPGDMQRYGGLHTVDEARALFTDGWAEGASNTADAAHAIAHLAPSSTIKRRVRRRMDDGGDLLLDQALQGEWDTAFMGVKKARVSATNVVSIGCGWAPNWNVNHDELLWNAVQMIVVCDILEQAGWRVEMRAMDVNWSEASKTHGVMDVLVKRAEDPMRADLVAATFGHAGVYRTLGFGLVLSQSQKLTSSLGRAASVDDTRKMIALAQEHGLLASVSLYMPRCQSRHECIANISTALTALHPPETAGVPA